MPNDPVDQSEVIALRTQIEQFIQARLSTKLEKLDKEIESSADGVEKQDLNAKRQLLLDEHQPAKWLESAANRAGQIQLVTHSVKFSHPSAGGSNIYLGNTQRVTTEELVGTHMLAGQFETDVVGNAAALDVFKFLTIEYSGTTVLERIGSKDPVLLGALSDDPEQAAVWVEQLSSVYGSEEVVASHFLSKQLYFPLPDGEYHLLAPLFPTSLVHTVHQHLRNALYSEEAGLARKARRENRMSDVGFSDFPHLATQNFGGSKPQNISQLNSERRGGNWLLASYPPNWHSRSIRPPLKVATVFGRWFGGRSRVRELTRNMSKFLASTDYNNVHIRDARARFVDLLVDELVQFAAELAELSPGWSTDPECRLGQAEMFWLDPGRSKIDEVFAADRQRIDWPTEIADRFGNWINAQLLYHEDLPVGEAEHAEWSRVVGPALESIRKELSYG